MLFYHTHEGPKHIRNETLPVDGVGPEKHAHPAQQTCAPPEADSGLVASCLLQGHVPFSGQPGKQPILKCCPFPGSTRPQTHPLCRSARGLEHIETACSFIVERHSTAHPRPVTPALRDASSHRTGYAGRKLFRGFSVASKVAFCI